jgi:hypothetical protein
MRLSVVLSLYPFAQPRAERRAERHPPTCTRGRRRLAALNYGYENRWPPAVAHSGTGSDRGDRAGDQAADTEKFTAAYKQLTEACDNCHQGAGRAMIVIKVPDSTMFPDQDFGPAPK